MTTMPIVAGPESVAAAFEQRFNAGDLEGLADLFEADAVFLPAPGQAVTTPEARRAALAQFLALRLPIRTRVRQAHAAGDAALLLVNWAIEGTAPDGQPVALRGTATDVVRRGPDGRWRYAIDNPFGTVSPA